ncbi:hypothetical protein DR71_1288 [Corynebacterium sp. ATCC 6931]|nr:hypothetical protein DR71_1288 [Corynebacterium sp. ATCC 6931]
MHHLHSPYSSTALKKAKLAADLLLCPMNMSMITKGIICSLEMMQNCTRGDMTGVPHLLTNLVWISEAPAPATTCAMTLIQMPYLP